MQYCETGVAKQIFFTSFNWTGSCKQIGRDQGAVLYVS